MQKPKREFVIPFVGLQTGSHVFEYELDNAFFEDFEYSIIHGGKVHVDLVLEKKETMLIGEFSIEGLLDVDCDRCNDPMKIPVKGNTRIVYKFSTEESLDETLVIVHPDDYEINVRDQIYELLVISLPYKLVHDEGECNPDVIEALRKYEIVEDKGIDDDDDFDSDDEDDDESDDDNDDIDPRWSVLKDLN